MTDQTLPEWAMVSEKRRAHIERVVALLASWAEAMRLPEDEASRWTNAGWLHDALRDAPEEMLRALSGDGTRPIQILHGPAAAVRAEQEGERRQDVLDAIRHHTIGFEGWNRTGKALYMADFLEPGRWFLGPERAYLAKHVAADFEGTFRQVLRLRIEWTLAQGGALFPEQVQLWNLVRSGD